MGARVGVRFRKRDWLFFVSRRYYVMLDLYVHVETGKGFEEFAAASTCLSWPRNPRSWLG